MNAIPSWTIGQWRFRCRALLALVFFAPAALAGVSPQDLQALGARIKDASDQVDAGMPVPPQAVSELARQFSVLRGALPAEADRPARQKFLAVAVLLARLQQQTANESQAAPLVHSAKLHSPIDREIVTAQHGSTCAVALGVSEALPVQVMLAAAGQQNAQAWFRFGSAPGRYRFTTNSVAADPTIEVFSSCASSAKLLASNDDTLGLDAAAAVAIAEPDGEVFVHVTNTGAGGTTVLSVSDANGAVSGVITDTKTGQPITNGIVYLLSVPYGYSVASGYTDQNGNYLVPVAPGTYYAQMLADGYVEILYPNVTCGPLRSYGYIGNCQVAQAQAVTVSSGATHGNINAALSSGQRISGIVRDTGNQPLVGSVTLYDSITGNALEYGGTDGFGRYTFLTLPPGGYQLSTQVGGYGEQMFDHVACGGALQNVCDLSKSSTIAITNADVAADFDLDALASIEGNVIGPDSLPISPYGATVNVADATGAIVAQSNTDANGHYSAGPLATGSYRVYAFANNYFSQVFSGIDCGPDCLNGTPGATGITISHDGQVATADFQLHALPVVQGHVQDAMSGLPLANVFVTSSIYPPSGYYSAAASATTDSNGNFSLTGTPAGKFYVLAQSNDHIDQIYSGIPCEQFGYYYYAGTPCDVSTATQLVIDPNTTPGALNFSLQRSSSISGHMLQRADTTTDLPAITEIDVYNGAGTDVASVQADTSGAYTVSDLPPGTYYVAAATNYYDYLEQLWQNTDCPSPCAPTSGTPVVLGAGDARSGIDFSLLRRSAIVGRVRDALGIPIAGVVVDLFYSSSGNYVASAISDVQGFYSVGGNTSDSFDLATEAGAGFIDQVYSGVACPAGPAYFGLCSLTGATPVPVSNNSTQPTVVNFVLKLGDRVFASGFETY